ncbi:hypothetical protein AB0883_07765 [Micromonospora sp. NPDC047812]|uniref:hypothetical protein n=1 Tax=Micromonospora sp. NPDC047812 TaxID=3155742 RepID=UPI003451B0B1
MSRQELADAVNAYAHAHTGCRSAVDARYIGRLERGEHRWPFEPYRTALREVLGKTTNADLGFFIIQGHAQDPQVSPEKPGPEGSWTSPAPGPDPGRPVAVATAAGPVIAVVERAFAKQKTATCALTGIPLVSRQEAHVDHAQPTFLDLATAFAEHAGGWDTVQVASGDGVIGTQMADDQQREAWCAFHAERANLRVVSIQANLSLLRRGQRRAADSAEDQA